MAQLHIEERQIGDVTVLDLDGEVRIGDSCIALRSTIRRVVEEGKKPVVLDLSDVRYIDSSGIMELVASYTTVSRAGGKVKLSGLTEKVQDLLTITKLLTVFDTYETVEDAVASLSRAPCSYTSCPVYACGNPLPSDPLSQLVCLNCGSKFIVHVEYPRGFFQASITSILLPAYEGEQITISPGTPTRIVIGGRLDLFTSETVERAWLTVPLPRYVIFDLEASSEINPAGAQKLVAICAGGQRDSRAVILTSSVEAKAVFPTDFPIHDNEADAIAALGKMTPAAKWTLSLQ